MRPGGLWQSWWNHKKMKWTSGKSCSKFKKKRCPNYSSKRTLRRTSSCTSKRAKKSWERNLTSQQKTTGNYIQNYYATNVASATTPTPNPVATAIKTTTKTTILTGPASPIPASGAGKCGGAAAKQRNLLQAVIRRNTSRWRRKSRVGVMTAIFSRFLSASCAGRRDMRVVSAHRIRTSGRIRTQVTRPRE